MIRVRKAFSVRLSKDRQHLGERANATHAHFVSGLEKVHHVLSKMMGRSGKAFNMALIKDATSAARDDSMKKAKPTF